MLTIEQLYALYELMDGGGTGYDGTPGKNAYADLKKLAETQYEEPPRHAMLRFASDALYKLVDQMEQAKEQKLNEDQFKASMKSQLNRFNVAYNKIPEDVFEDEGLELKKAMDGIASLNVNVKEDEEIETLNINEEIRKSGPESDERTESVSARNISQETNKFDRKEPEDKVKFSPEEEYNREMEAMGENLMKLAAAVNKLRVKDDKLSVNDWKDLVDVKVDSLKRQMATMMAMDQIKRYSGLKAASDLEMVDNTADLIMAEPGFEDILERLDKSDLSKGSIATIFDIAGYKNLSKLIEQPVKKEEKPVRRFKENSAALLFKKGMEGLQNNVKEASQRTLNKNDAKQIAGGLVELFALRELGKKDPFRTVTTKELDEQKKAILNPENKSFSLYRAVLKKSERDPDTAVRVAAGLKGEESMDQFRRGLMRDARIEKKVPEKTGNDLQKI